jgi:hypothetical protein
MSEGCSEEEVYCFEPGTLNDLFFEVCEEEGYDDDDGVQVLCHRLHHTGVEVPEFLVLLDDIIPTEGCEYPTEINKQTPLYIYIPSNKEEFLKLFTI